ncbi:tram-like protein [Campylobacter sp. US18a]|nr:tram-like protein [Campylobacter jejuni]TEY10665.1 tram-like protein [Campylobacter sp. US18a]HEC1873829.1 tram-like protein [Campylobacter jejuni]HEC1875114.1 tram-like protein [Campylobacter jejuni]HEC1877146.1 tram-like protein [Campylobacter jejuni]
MIKILEQTIKSLKLNLKPYDLSMLTRKKSYICAKDQNNILFIYTGKTKFLMKDALFLENLAQQININNKYFFSMTSLCSKAKNHLEMKGFNIYVAL